MMQVALRDSAGRFRYPGMTGNQLEQVRQARSVESAVAEDGWNLTTTDGDIPEDVVAAYISPNAPNHWGSPALLGRWLIPADAYSELTKFVRATGFSTELPRISSRSGSST